MHEEASRLLRSGKAVAFVPTMGFLHEGHLELMRQGRNHGEVLIMSVFVNPTQFGPSEDFEAYPRNFDRDLRLAESAGVDIVFAPQAEAMYDKGYQTHVELDGLPKHLCGLRRPGHFTGVATVVTKLFNIVRPQVAVFGEKDYQQLVIIRRMVQDLNFDIRIVGVPTVREPDGLAMSSRNTYLSEDERASALSLFTALQQARQNVARGMRDAVRIIDEASTLIGSHAHTKIDYVSLCDPETLDDVEAVEGQTLLALAVWVGKTRLIDNTILKP
jgi:pantoate--beta-alanine ligase